TQSAAGGGKGGGIRSRPCGYQVLSLPGMGMNIGMKTMQRSARSVAPTATIRRLPASGNTALAASALIQAALGIEFFLSGLNKFADPDFVRNFILFVDASSGTQTVVLSQLIHILV